MLCPCRCFAGTVVLATAPRSGVNMNTRNTDNQWSEGNHSKGEALEAQVHKIHRHQAGFPQSHTDEQNGFQPRRIGWESDNDSRIVRASR